MINNNTTQKLSQNKNKFSSKEYYIKNKERLKAWKIQNKEKLITYHREYDKRPEVRKRRREYLRNKSKTDSNYKLRMVLANHIHRALKCARKTNRTINLLGCTIEEAKRYIESQWLPGMTWDNHAPDGWHIDHIKPCNTFNLTDPKQQEICFHYTNLRPLWYKDNLSRPKDGSDILSSIRFRP